MQVSSGQDGIQRLLAAEAEAQAVAAKARKGKRKRESWFLKSWLPFFHTRNLARRLL